MPVPTTYAAAVYVHGTIIPPAWFNFNNVWLARAIEGTAGCGVGEAYTPVDPIRINGGGIATETFLALEAGAYANVASTAEVEFDSGSILTVSGGATVTSNSGATWTFAGPITLSASGSIALSPSRTFSRLFAPWVSTTADGFGTPNSLGNVTSSGVAGGEASTWIDLPAGAVVTGYKADIDPAGGHVGLPGTMPTLKLISAAYGAYPGTTEATVTDSSASVAAYEAQHSITATGLSVTIDSAKRYRIAVTPESGANALAGMIAVSGAQVTYTLGTVDFAR